MTEKKKRANRDAEGDVVHVTCKVKRERGGVMQRDVVMMMMMVPARWEGAGAGLSWITMTRYRGEKIHTHTHY